jgi:hypothetical protein
VKLGEVKDIVREHVGRDSVSDVTLDWAIVRGLREIEQRDTFYWMEAHKQFHILDGQQTYPISRATDGGLDLSDYRSPNFLLVSDRTADDPSWIQVDGPEIEGQAQVNFAEGSEGTPSFFSVREVDDDPMIVVWPPLPDQDYLAQWHYYRWTTLPTATTSDEHEVLRRWPEALIYTATAQAILVKTKDPELASFWNGLFYNPNPLIQCEYKRIKLFEKQRKQGKRSSNNPTNQQSTLTNRALDHARRWF